jgi:hypothetical protein
MLTKNVNEKMLGTLPKNVGKLMKMFTRKNVGITSEKY